MTAEQERRDCVMREQIRRDWWQAHPTACRRCDATGFLDYRENLGPHGGPVMMAVQTEECSNCVAEGKCPVCGAVLEWNEQTEEWVGCPSCEWEPGAESPVPPSDRDWGCSECGTAVEMQCAMDMNDEEWIEKLVRRLARDEEGSLAVRILLGKE